MGLVGKEPRIPLTDLLFCLSDVIDLVSPSVADHHKRVAYIASSIGAEFGLPVEQQNELVLAGILHDVGALSLKQRLDLLQFEVQDPHRHALIGYQLLQPFGPLSEAALLVRYHHASWNGDVGEREPAPLGSYVLHLADRVDTLMNRQRGISESVRREVCERIGKLSGQLFMPDLVDAFMHLARREYFWYDIVSPSLDAILSRRVRSVTVELDTEGLLDLTGLFARVIDFRSRFTATHSSGVAATAEALARLVGVSAQECQMMRVAGYLHDLGKLVVPAEILEKPGPLTGDEWAVMRAHAYHTHRVLETVRGLELVNAWAALHHERLNGEGYPFHLEGRDLALGSRLMAVADVFTAVTEGRPYAEALPGDQALQVLQQMAGDALDSTIVSLLGSHFDEVNAQRVAMQEAAVREYEGTVWAKQDEPARIEKRRVKESVW